ncbi:MAG: phosphodiester glycosidase family protein, partial [Lachnospiraceae bacterium]|nr:phosphodiester glycosidase family protein [Lachnospiraceae bacterium]
MFRNTKKLMRSAVSFVVVLVLSVLTSLSAVPAHSVQAAASSDFVTPEGLYLIYSTEYNIAPGIVETQYVTNTEDGSDQEMGYAVTIDLSNPTVSIGAGYKDNDASQWGMQTVRKQALAAEADNGYNVVAAVNADFFNMATGSPSGTLIMNGTVYHESSSPVFAIMEDGSAAILPNGMHLQGVKEAVGGSCIMLVNGEIPTGFEGAYYVGKEPRTAVGIKADGSVVMFVGDGCQYPKSSGLTIYELAKMMKALGCVTALNLDGGGSSTFATEREGSNELLVHNSPSDGVEREVSSSLFVFSTAKSDGVFDHAVLLPNNDAYTPYSSVQFNASGVDSAGGAAALPDNVTYDLAADSEDMGTITENGLFTSNGTTGNVTVNLLQDGEIVGTTSIVVTTPDTIQFSNEEVSLGFSTPSDLGLIVSAGGRELIYNDNDFEWTMSNPSMGSFDGNIFTSSDDATVTGTITCAYKYDTSVLASVTAIIGKLPTVVWDFENVEEYAGLTSSNYGRGGKQSVEIVSIDDGERVRFGQRALKLNYDFINCGAVTEGACIGMSEAYEIPGVPTGIGVWVYAPEGTAPSEEQKAAGYSGFWLRGYFNDGSGRQQAFNYTLEPKQCTNGQQAGIYWEGWHYCEADLTQYSAPFSIQPGMTFRVMYVAGTKMGTNTAGAVYFDNLQFVYGANVDDIDSPVIDTIEGNETEITNGMVFDTNTITFTSTFHDVESKYMTGIDYDVVRMYIDGVNVVDNSMYVLDKGGNKSWYYDVKLANGEHSIKMLLRDGFGNETTDTRFFVVDAENNDVVTMGINAVGTPVLGETFALELTSNDIEAITEFTLGMRLDDHFTVKNVVFADGFSGYYSYKNKELTIEAAGGTSNDSDAVATVYFDIPAEVPAGVNFTYYTTLGSFKTFSGNDATFSFSVAPQSVSVSAPISIITEDTIIVGREGAIKVIDIDGAPVPDADVIYAGYIIGTTNEDGILYTTAFSAESGKFEVSAKCDRGVSYTTTIYSVNAVGTNTPYNVLSNAVVDGNTQKSFSWMTSVLESQKQAVAQIALASDYEADGVAAFNNVYGESTDRVFVSGPAEGYATVRVNTVTIDSLVAGETYAYRVGDGETWSEVKTFTEDAKDGEVNFFIIGDIQAKDLANNTKVIEGILSRNDNYTFGLQTGDVVDGGSVYSYWDELLSSFEATGLGGIDMVHVLGNHEYEGDKYADNGKNIFNLPSATCYSLEYDNLYIAVINYKSADNDVLAETMEWLINDANKSTAQWKILSMHQPPYYTNISGGGEYLNKHFPAAVDAAGIDMVFSGHDHTLARTLPLTGGEVDENNGTVYYICGSTGEKSYAAFDTPEFHFAYTNDSFDAVYTTVSVTASEISVVNYNLDGSVLDSYTMHSSCGQNGHQYVYADGMLICSECGNAIDLAETKYTGFAKDKATGRKMYFVAGNVYAGRLAFGETEYIFDEDGLGVDGEYVVTCKVGDLVFECEDGLVVNRNGLYEFNTKQNHGIFKGYINNEPAVGWVELFGNTYYFKDGVLRTSATTISSVIYNFDSKGIYQGGVFKKSNKGTKYYDRGVCITGWYEINDNTYYFGDQGYMTTGVAKIEDSFYTFDENGILVSEEGSNYIGFVKDGNDTYYYENGVRVTGWKQIGDDYYYFGSDGAMYVKNKKINNVLCEFAADGKYQGGTWYKTNKGTKYYYAGSFITGWYDVDGATYYFNASGYMLTGTNLVDGLFYTFDENGVLMSSGESRHTGFTTEGKYTYYYEDGTLVTGWKQIGDDYYYFGSNGVMTVGTKKVDNIYCRFAADGKYQGGTWSKTSKGTKYYYAGSFITGWYDADGATYYFNANGYMLTGTNLIDGLFYTFDEYGMLVSTGESQYTGFSTVEKNTYYYEDGVLATGWKLIGEDYYYFGSDGVMATGTKKVNNVPCKFASDGKYQGGTWYKSSKGVKYYYAGEFILGWYDIDGLTYYFNDDYYRATGVAIVDGLFYEFTEEGVLTGEGIADYTGYLVSGKYTYYYEDGVMATGWKEINGVFHYFHSNGSMAVYATKIDGVKYQFSSDGSHTVGTWKTNNHGTRYYFAGSYVVGTIVIDGITYTFDENGYRVNEED